MIFFRPQYVVFPHDTRGFAIDNQLYLGSSGLLIKPVVGEGVTEAELYISDDQVSYNFFHSQFFTNFVSSAILRLRQ